LLLELHPIGFTYWRFALILLLNGLGMGLFAAPNRAGIMNSLPGRRGVGAGMSATFRTQPWCCPLASSSPDHPGPGLLAAHRAQPWQWRRVSPADAARVAALPPVSVLFAALLGYSPVRLCSAGARQA
jgi:hypothetical protein